MPTVTAARGALLGDSRSSCSPTGSVWTPWESRRRRSTAWDRRPLYRRCHSGFLAACSPKSTVNGWGPDGAASCLALLLGLETSGSLVTRDLPADAKLAAVSGIFCLDPERGAIRPSQPRLRRSPIRTGGVSRRRKRPTPPILGWVCTPTARLGSAPGMRTKPLAGGCFARAGGLRGVFQRIVRG